MDERAVLDALRLRIDAVRIDSFRGREAISSELGLTLYTGIVRVDDRSVELTIVASDGRGYRRRIEAERNIEARTIAGTLAVIAYAIADGSEPPDRADAVIPDERADEPLAGTEAGDDPTTTAATANPAPDPSDDSLEASPQRTPEDRPPAQDSSRTPPPPLARSPSPSPPPGLGISLAAGLLLPLTPAGTGPQPFAEAQSRYRNAKGRHLGLRLRYAARRRAQHRLHRVRLTAEGGHTFARRRFVSPVAIGVSVEPWTIRGPDGRGELTEDDDETTPIGYRPLVGLNLCVQPSLRITATTAPGPQIAVGALIELAGSLELGGRFGAPRVTTPGGTTADPDLGLGGLELVAGLGVTGWFARH
ncbi:MAG: hypothetical protein B7733_17025 [Myxococcales bacterium FL481]|nr:MAG: hypothetical protein B7733_17025 [Myxococcales bacterium FL481]